MNLDNATSVRVSQSARQVTDPARNRAAPPPPPAPPVAELHTGRGNPAVDGRQLQRHLLQRIQHAQLLQHHHDTQLLEKLTLLVPWQECEARLAESETMWRPRQMVLDMPESVSTQELDAALSRLSRLWPDTQAVKDDRDMAQAQDFRANKRQIDELHGRGKVLVLARERGVPLEAAARAWHQSWSDVELSESEAEQLNMSFKAVGIEPPPELVLRSIGGDAPESAPDWDSHYDFYEKLMAALVQLEGPMKNRYAHILEKFIRFFDRLTGSLTALKDSILGTDDKGNLTVDFSLVRQHLNALSLNFEGLLDLGGGFADRDEALSFLGELGLGSEGGLVVKPDGDGWQLAIDPAKMEALRDIFPAAQQSGVSPHQFSVWMSAKDSLMEKFNLISRVVTEKYQRQLSLWDTLVKALSGTIDAIAEADRLFAQNLT
jgi:hypothetical protein